MGEKVEVNLTLADVYKILCPTCKENLRKLVKEKVEEKVTDMLLGG
jgi:uncharacterized protein with PIN domain